MFREAGFHINKMIPIKNDSFYVSAKPTYRNSLDRLRHKIVKAVVKMLSHQESETFQFVVRAEARES